MATLLHRLGRFAYRRPVLVLSVWVAVLFLLGAGAAMLHRPMASTVSIPGTESQRAIDLLKQRMPQASVGNASARIVFTVDRSAKVTDPGEDGRASSRRSHKVSALPHVVAVIDPFTAKTISPGQRTAVASAAVRRAGQAGDRRPAKGARGRRAGLPSRRAFRSSSAGRRCRTSRCRTPRRSSLSASPPSSC